MVAFSVFYKDIKNAIEPTIQATTQLRLSFVNAKSAYLRGIEFEFRKKLGFINPALQYLSLWGSYVYTESEMELTPQAGFVPTSLNRPLVGQPPHMANLALEYDNPNIGLDARLTYRLTDSRVFAVGGLGLPDIVQEKTEQFDLVVVKKLTPQIDLRFVIQNISDDPVKYTQGGEIWRYYRTGRTFKLGISHKW
jgi:outer membrane receptor protein involved in Fe transport